MPTKTKPKPKAKQKPLAAAEVRSAVSEVKAEYLKQMVAEYEQATGARANQVRLIDFIRWWEEREKQ
ncbi:hypothetical protein LCGC14_2884530 [marine sediment metagenome]|uniref:Uncharacterized protein n=1 Tax=marine sediment metagenome TaxID=412755 RepID=A0A0F8XZD7_9ZZZZ